MTRSLPLPVLDGRARPPEDTEEARLRRATGGGRRPEHMDDPMELVGVALQDGDSDAMVDSLVDEFVRMGMDEDELMQLFRHPHYRMTHAIYCARGEEWVRGVVQRVFARWGASHG